MAQFYLDPSELETDPPAKLTKRGLEMLTEIWDEAGRPAKPPTDEWADAAFIDIHDLDSHYGNDAATQCSRRAFASDTRWLPAYR